MNVLKIELDHVEGFYYGSVNSLGGEVVDGQLYLAYPLQPTEGEPVWAWDLMSVTPKGVELPTAAYSWEVTGPGQTSVVDVASVVNVILSFFGVDPIPQAKYVLVGFATSGKYNIKVTETVSGGTDQMPANIVEVDILERIERRGFDPTVAKPYWVSVPWQGGTNSEAAEAWTTPEDCVARVKFQPATGDEGKILVSPATAAATPQPLTFTSRGWAEMKSAEAVVNAMIAGGVADSVRVKIYEQKSYKVAIHAITLRRADGTLLAPQGVPSGSALEASLNEIWSQACIQFEVSRADATLSYDLDGDGKLRDNGDAAERTIVYAAATAGVDVNVYYVNALASGLRGAGSIDRIFIACDGRQAGSSVEAHELGHIQLLGRLDDVGDRDRLMFAVESAATRLIKAEWDRANP